MLTAALVAASPKKQDALRGSCHALNRLGRGGVVLESPHNVLTGTCSKDAAHVRRVRIRDREAFTPTIMMCPSCSQMLSNALVPKEGTRNATLPASLCKSFAPWCSECYWAHQSTCDAIILEIQCLLNAAVGCRCSSNTVPTKLRTFLPACLSGQQKSTISGHETWAEPRQIAAGTLVSTLVSQLLETHVSFGRI